MTWKLDVVFDCGDLGMNGIIEMTECMNQNFDERILNGMSILAAIVQCGSFAGAGKALNMSQSGASRSIARLESRLGIRLFERTTRSVSMTDEGRSTIRSRPGRCHIASARVRAWCRIAETIAALRFGIQPMTGAPTHLAPNCVISPEMSA